MSVKRLVWIPALLALPLSAETRQHDAHEHGVGVLNIALEGETVAMEFEVPGADIVGFEHAAESAEDRAAIEAAIGVLSQPLSLFVPPQEAGCSVTRAEVEVDGFEDHADGHDDHGHDAHGHDDHASEAEGHMAFHARYEMNCTTPGALESLSFAYFERFPNAVEVEVQVISDTGAVAAEVSREAPVLSLGGGA